jgi:signal transduction histidine kinase
VALDCPLDVEVAADLPGRLDPPVESAAYFAVRELLTNAAKHSGASRIRVDLHHADQQLTITVHDDGHGGADPAAGTGLDGLRRRLSAFDGVLTVLSPPGGPSELTMELPCASSSPRTSPSSGTAWSGC